MEVQDKKEQFLELLDPIRDKLYLYALALEKNTEDAEDLVGETILTCYEYFHKLKDIKSFKAYMFKTARTKFRREKHRSWLFGQYDDKQAENLISNDAQPDLPIDIELLYKALGRLPAKQSEAVILFEISGFSLNEIRQIQGGTLSAIKSRVKRGREKLSEMLCDDNNSNRIDNKSSMFTKKQVML